MIFSQLALWSDCSNKSVDIKLGMYKCSSSQNASLVVWSFYKKTKTLFQVIASALIIFPVVQLH
jgi:hypothetical protein